ncbi:phosphotransferase [Spirosoma pulveris]
MNYFHFDPFSKQYLFPEEYKKYPFLLSFYQPYTLLGWLMWFLWRKFSVIRLFCRVKGLESILPFNIYCKYISANSIVAFNLGTPGTEQKTTILGIDKLTGEKFFIKYATRPLALSNVKKEALVLSHLTDLPFVPKLLASVSDPDYTLIKTNVFDGVKVTTQNIEDQLLSILSKLAKQGVSLPQDDYSLDTCFAHGDFCPWNMIVCEDKLFVYDWEMATYYPLGYDLFTYVFQTSFLLQPRISIESILEKNKGLLNLYFQDLEIDTWHPYLLSFAQIKLEAEIKKKNIKLITHYESLRNYAKGI